MKYFKSFFSNFIWVYLLLYISNSSYGQKKDSPKTIGQVKDFTGKITSSSLYEGEFSFTIKDLNSGATEIYFYFQTGADPDPYNIECKIDEDLRGRISTFGYDETGEPKICNINVKVTAKYTYGLFPNYENGKTEKRTIWRPLKVIEVD
jgi:hypothetical protein